MVNPFLTCASKFYKTFFVTSSIIVYIFVINIHDYFTNYDGWQFHFINDVPLYLPPDSGNYGGWHSIFQYLATEETTLVHNSRILDVRIYYPYGMSKSEGFQLSHAFFIPQAKGEDIVARQYKVFKSDDFDRYYKKFYENSLLLENGLENFPDKKPDGSSFSGFYLPYVDFPIPVFFTCRVIKKIDHCYGHLSREGYSVRFDISQFGLDKWREYVEKITEYLDQAELEGKKRFPRINIL
jgi:hypothetical protein